KLEDYVEGMITIEKKHYCKIKEDGTISYTGLSPAKPSVAGLIKYTCKSVCEQILRQTTHDTAGERIVRLFDMILAYLTTQKPTVSELSGLSRIDGVRSYKYVSAE